MNFLQDVDVNDVVATDGGYGRIQEKILGHIKPHRKPKNKTLSPSQIEENDVITEFRGDIERKWNFKDKIWNSFKSL